VSESPQRRALKTYRKRLSQRGMARFEVLARRTDRELIRSLARVLAEDGAKANRIRESLKRLAADPSSKGGLLAALRSSPLVGAELDLTRPVIPSRNVGL
jgi:hypothetical protein